MEVRGHSKAGYPPGKPVSGAVLAILAQLVSCTRGTRGLDDLWMAGTGWSAMADSVLMPSRCPKLVREGGDRDLPVTTEGVSIETQRGLIRHK